MKIRISPILDILLGIIICSYAGPFASYVGINVLIFITLLLYLFIMNAKLLSVKRQKIGLSWSILFCFMCFNALLNVPKSLFYLMIFIFGMLILKRNLQEDNISLIKNILRVVSIALTISIIVQVFIPSVFYKFARVWFFYSNQYDMVYRTESISHHYSGLMYEVSYSAVVLAIGICIFFADVMTKQKGRLLNICLIIAAYFAIFMTGKRSFILIIPVSLAIYWFIFSVDRLNPRRLLVIAIAVIIFICLAGDIFSWVANILGKGQAGIQLSSRERYWEITIDMFKDNPIIGQGLNSFDVWFNQSGIKSHYFDFAGAHNSYLQVLAEMGILGFAMYFFCIGQNIYNGMKKLRLSTKIHDNEASCNLIFALGGLTCMLIYGFSGNSLYQPQQLVTFFFLIAVIRSTLPNKDKVQ